MRLMTTTQGSRFIGGTLSGMILILLRKGRSGITQS